MKKSSHRLKKKDLYSVVFMLGVSTVGAGVYVSSAEGGQEELDSLELELQVFMIQPVSETESGFLQGEWALKVRRIEPGSLPGQSRLSHVTARPGRVPEMYEFALDS